MFDGLPFDAFALLDDGLSPAEVGIGRSQVVRALVVTPMIAGIDEGLDPELQVTGQEVVFRPNAVLQSLVPALDPAWVWGCMGASRTRLMASAWM